MLPTPAAAIRRTRQHHAIEHATIHLLTARFPGQRFSGLSDAFGFTIYADVDEADLWRAVDDAITRMKAGEAGLAIHPNCGTNLATTALLATGAALISMAAAATAANAPRGAGVLIDVTAGDFGRISDSTRAPSRPISVAEDLNA